MLISRLDGATAHILPVAGSPPPEPCLLPAFDTPATHLARPMALKSVYTALGLSTSGEGAGDQQALALAKKWGVAAAIPWSGFVRDAAGAAGEAAAEGSTAIAKLADGDAGEDLLTCIAGMAKLDPAGRSSIMLEAIALDIYDVTDHEQTGRRCLRVWGSVQQDKRSRTSGRARYSAIVPHVGDRPRPVTPCASSGAFARSGSTWRATTGARP